MVEPYESAIEIIRYLQIHVKRLGDAFTNTDSDNYQIVEDGLLVKNPKIFLVCFQTLDKLKKGSIDITVYPRTIYGEYEEKHDVKLDIPLKEISFSPKLPENLETRVKDITDRHKWKLIN